MEVLDKVYTTFKNLDRDFAKSKKTRTEFIVDKFGGDIDIGSMLILDAISSSSGSENVEDINKQTFIKQIFEKIKENRDKLDMLENFTFSEDSFVSKFSSLLRKSLVAGTGNYYISQEELYKKSGCFHFVSTQNNGNIMDVKDNCKILNAFNANMANSIGAAMKTDVSVGDIYHVINHVTFEKVSRSTATSMLKSK